MDTIFINSENSKTSKSHVLILKLVDKLDLRRGEKSVALSNLSIYYTWKNIKGSYNIIINLKYHLQHGMMNLNHQMDHTLYQIFRIALSIFQKKHNESIDNPSIRIYVKKIENRITFKIKTGYYLELLTPETIKLLGSTENEITKNKYGENVPHLEITKVVPVHCNIVNNDSQQDSRVLYTFVPNKPFGQLLEISPPNFIFSKHLIQNFKPLKCGLRIKTVNH